ncbi:hypothetical protein FACS18945_4860 [Bacteroidia bacterium]|nr:hypothetical protein FACS18945_4860 [Bacteroidia bacterium]
MAGKTSIRPKKPQRKIVISTEFVLSLADIKNYGEKTFGKMVSDKFIREIRRTISLLSKQPDTNPKNRFIESTEHKTYRNILYKSYAVLYSITATKIDVIEIYHQSINPETIKTFIEKEN